MFQPLKKVRAATDKSTQSNNQCPLSALSFLMPSPPLSPNSVTFCLLVLYRIRSCLTELKIKNLDEYHIKTIDSTRLILKQLWTMGASGKNKLLLGSRTAELAELVLIVM